MCKNSHLTIEERNTILLGIQNNASFTAIAKTIGKDPTTVKKEIMKHRIVSYHSPLPMQCKNYKTCQLLKSNESKCRNNCPRFEQFYCKRKEKVPGACNGCPDISYCRYDKMKYIPSNAEHEYIMLKKESREGFNITSKEVEKIAKIIKPLLDAGQSPYMILESNKDIGISEKTLYTYIENGLFKDYGIDSFKLRKYLQRKIPKDKKNLYKKRNDYKYLNGRKYEDYLKFIEENPNAMIVQMDTVYNDVTNGPFIQTFKFINAKILFGVFHKEKTSAAMVAGVNLLEQILGEDIFAKYVNVLLTDRGTEFVDADNIEYRKDKSKRTNIFYCDPMQSNQKAMIERNHEELRYHFPKETNLYDLGLVSQEVLNLSLSHLNSIPLESIGGKTALKYAEFLYEDLFDKIKRFGIIPIDPNLVILTPTLFKK